MVTCIGVSSVNIPGKFPPGLEGLIELLREGSTKHRRFLRKGVARWLHCPKKALSKKNKWGVSSKKRAAQTSMVLTHGNSRSAIAGHGGIDREVRQNCLQSGYGLRA
jgi:hypothetical protein